MKLKGNNVKSFQQTHYKFQESEIKHGQRLGNFRHTRMLRRAILAHYNKNDYKSPIYAIPDCATRGSLSGLTIILLVTPPVPSLP